MQCVIESHTMLLISGGQLSQTTCLSDAEVLKYLSAKPLWLCEDLIDSLYGTWSGSDTSRAVG